MVEIVKHRFRPGARLGSQPFDWTAKHPSRAFSVRTVG